MKKIKVMTVVGTRPEIIRLSSVIQKLNNTEAIEHILVHTGQNYDYELNEIFFKDLEINKPDYYLNVASKTPCETIGNILREIDIIIEKIKPDAFLILGDTNSCLSCIAAKKRHIPIFHMEAGNRCFDQRVPEETNRKIVDHISDINIPYSSIAREYLLREGINPDRIIKVGSPMLEVINSHIDQIYNSDILDKIGVSENNYFLVSAHREENISNESNFDNLINSLNTIAKVYEKTIIVTTHPRTRKMIEDNNIELNSNIRLMRPFGFSDYIKLQKNAKVVLSDSGTISEETSILGLSALNIRQSHERPEAMEESTVMMTGLNSERILQGISILESKVYKKPKLVVDYNIENVSEKIVKIIISYVDYIKRVVWFEK